MRRSNNAQPWKSRMPLLTAALVLGLTAPPLFAQNGRPMPDEAPTPAIINPAMDNPVRGPLTTRTIDTLESRRGMEDGDVVMAFNDVPITEFFQFIVKNTGKVVIPVKPETLTLKKITLLHNQPISRQEALDLIFSAFRMNEIGVIETDTKIIIGDINSIVDIVEMPVLGPNDDVMSRRDYGNFVVKFFRLKEAEAENVGEHLEDHLPEYGEMTIDPTSNQLMAIGDVSMMQHLQKLINELDRVDIPVETKTYRLRYADASEIADNILELFDTENNNSSSSSRATPQRNNRRGSAGRRGAPDAGGIPNPGPSVEMRLTVNTQQNTVTVQADPSVVKEVDKLIAENWDLPRPEGTQKTYLLQYTDPLKVRDMLEELLEGGSGSSGGARRTGGGGRSGGNNRSGVEQAISGIYQIEAYPDSNTLVVLCKTEESFAFLDSIVHEIDQPSSVGLPVIMELKHAEAVSLADELNVLLAEAGAQVTLERPDRGLTAQGIGTADSGGGGGAAAGGREAEEGGEMRFPWMSGGRQREDQTPESSLIGKIRVVPILRQNALAILAPPQYQERVRELVHYLDRPGRQVMISAVIAEVELTDDFSLGLRVSATDIPLTKIDNSISANLNSSNSVGDVFSGVFDTSTLGLDFSVNAVFQALEEKTNVKVLQEPRVFTADNQEAVFFDGQDIPFVTDSFVNNTGGLTQGFEYRQVGVVLNARPRITAEKDVDMEIYLELSSIVPGQTLFGGFIVDRRSTTTQVVVKDGQTIVISGILRDTESEIKRKIPGLGSLPIVGGLFQSSESNKVTTELVAFITPTVVDNPSENDHNFNAIEREKLGNMQVPLNQMDNTGQRGDVRSRIVEPRANAAPLVAPDGEAIMIQQPEWDRWRPNDFNPSNTPVVEEVHNVTDFVDVDDIN